MGWGWVPVMRPTAVPPTAHPQAPCPVSPSATSNPGHLHRHDRCASWMRQRAGSCLARPQRPPDSVKGGCGLHGRGPMNLPRLSPRPRALTGSVAARGPGKNSGQNPRTSSLRSGPLRRPLEHSVLGRPGEMVGRHPMPFVVKQRGEGCGGPGGGLVAGSAGLEAAVQGY